MQKLNISILLFITIVITALGCSSSEVNIEDLGIESKDIYDIAIEGVLTTDNNHHYIILSKPNGLSNNKFNPINNAIVKVSDGETYYDFELTEDEGVYQTVDSVAGKVGKTYTLIVEYNNKTYYASDSIVECNNVIDYPCDEVLVRYDFNEEDCDYFQFNTMKHNFGHKTPAIWFNATFFRAGQVLDYGIWWKRQNSAFNHVGSFTQGVFPTTSSLSIIVGNETDSVEITKMSVSVDYNNYLVSYFNTTDWSGGAFSTIPGNAKTNVSDGGIGYFSCVDVKRHRITLRELFDITKPTVIVEKEY